MIFAVLIVSHRIDVLCYAVMCCAVMCCAVDRVQYGGRVVRCIIESIVVYGWFV